MGMIPCNVHRILREDLTLGGPVSVSCSTNAVYARHKPDNTNWIYKVDIHPAGVLAEALGWLLCNDLDIPIPVGVAVCEPRRRPQGRPAYTWASEYARLGHWDPTHLSFIRNPTMFAAILVLDAWLGNADRHDENWVVEVGTGPSVDLVALDFDAAWVGRPYERATSGTAVPYSPNIVPLAPPLWRGAVDEWVARARDIPGDVLQAYVIEACELSGTGDAPAVLSWLRERRDSLGTLARQVANHYERMQS